jgi:CBS domain-containing protein
MAHAAAADNRPRLDLAQHGLVAAALVLPLSPLPKEGAMPRLTDRPIADLVHHQTPVVASPRGTVQAACRAMQESRVGCVLVVERGRLCGIFTGRDAVSLLAKGTDSASLRLAGVMTRNPMTLAPGATALEALRCMQDGGFRHVPIVDGDKVVGVVSRGDFRAMEHARLDEETGLWERL